MDSSDELLTIAELSIGLAGFSGVVAAFTHRGRLSATDRYNFVVLFSVAFVTAFLCFVPFGASHLTGSERALWQYSSAVAGAAGIATAFGLAAMAPAGMRANPQTGPLGGSGVSWGVPVLILAIQVSNMVGWPSDPGALQYVVGLLGWLLVAGFSFLRLVLHRSEGDNDPAN